MLEEARQFFRYVLPGLLFIIETLLFAYIILPTQTACFLQEHIKELGTAATVTLASAGLGFFFASIHHWFSWYVPCYSDIFDHRAVLKQLLEKKLIDIGEPELETVGLTKAENNVSESCLYGCAKRKAMLEAEKHTQSLWFRLFKPDQLAETATANLGNQAQGLGAACIASVFALVTGLSLSYRFCVLQFDCHNILMGSVSVAMIVMFYCSYRRVAKLTHGIYLLTLVEKARQEKGGAASAPN